MTIRRVPFILCGAALLALGACSSDGAATSTTTTSNPSTAATTTSSTIAALGTVTASTAAAGAGAASSSSSLPGAVGAPGATTTTVKGARVVTSPSDNLRIGDTGPGVKQVQDALVAKGFKIVVDSQYGLQTAKAMQDFQGQNGLTADGVCGPKTWAKLGGAGASTATTAAGSPTTAAGATATTAAATTSSAP